jgi:NAD(P)-dependent dehydrogenase (short-subunit alcohol dehydrogenase family)
VLTVRTDVGDPAGPRLADAAVERFGAVHVVCNNAGIALFDRWRARHADWEYTMRVDFWGVVHGVETFCAAAATAGPGRPS